MITGFKKKNIYNRSFGEKLKNIRLRKNRKLFEAEDATKVRLRYLEAFENDEMQALPGPAYSIGFLERYLEFLEVKNPESYLTEFKRNLAAWESFNKYKLTPKRSVKEPRVIITPKIIFSGIAGMLVVVLTGYIWLQVRLLTAPPELVIISPSKETKVAIEAIEIAGKTDPGAVVSINSQVISQDTQGNFKEKIALDSGVNTIQVVAKNRFNKETSKTINVLRTQNQTNETGGEIKGENG